MISKNKARFIISLQKKKVREEERLFLIEGDKLVTEFLRSGREIKHLIAKAEFLSKLPEELTASVEEVITVSYEELKSISTLKTPHNAMAVVPVPILNPDINLILNEFTVALDFVQDPGNMGTIIRAAAWFGIKNIVCSENSVDLYNPKVVQSSMGALLNVNVFYSDLKALLSVASEKKIPVFGTLLEGESIYNHKLDSKGVILLGNESRGISENLLPYITERIVIPKFSKAREGIDSLNVGMAASIVFSEFLRRKH